jgi:serine protease
MSGRLGLHLLTGTVALATLAACDQVQSRLDKFSKLSKDVEAQISGDVLGQSAPDPLTAAPLDKRALAGRLQAPVPIQPMTLDEMLSTQSFYAVGSVIAKPKEDLTEPVVDSVDLAAADNPATATAPGAALAPTAAPAPDAAGAAAAPDQAAGAEASAAAAPAAEADPGAPKRRLLALRPGVAAPHEIVQPPSAPEMRRQAEIAPRALERTIARSGVRLSPEALEAARAEAADMRKVDSQTAQHVGDQWTRRVHDRSAPMPRALAIRTRLNPDRALAAKTRAFNKLAEMGLSGAVAPEEGGQMRIVIGVDPTRFNGKIDPTKIDSMRARFARHKEKPSQECPGNPTKAKMQADPVLATECVVKALQATGDYEYVEKDYIFTNQFMKKPKKANPNAPAPGQTQPTGPVTAVSLAPNDPLFGLQWNLKDIGKAAGQSQGGAGFANFWQRARTTGSKSVTIALVDTGIQMSHPDMHNSKNIAPGYDMVSDPVMANDGDGRDSDPNDPGDKCDPNDPTAEDSFHGTHVAGILGAAGTNNGAGVAGGDWDVTIVPVRALGRCGGKLSDINDAIRWAAGKVPARDAQGNEVWNEHPADIINLSIGLFEPCPASMQSAINDAVAAGAIVVVAAGNFRVDTKYVAPGGCANVISVAAGNALGALAPYSNWGPGVTIMAPGGDMTRDDDGDGRPDGILSTKFSTDCYDPAKPGVEVAQCYYSYENGTSMAAPHVAAALALLKAKFPNALPSELKSRLLAASTARTPLQCSGKCSNYPGSQPIPGQDGLCFLPCGGAMLNLANASLQ